MPRGALKALVDNYVNGTDDGSHSSRLLEAGAWATPRLIAVFERMDPFRTTKAKIRYGQASSPAKQAMRLLRDCHHPELIRLLLIWMRVRGHEKQVRDAIFCHLLESGADEVTPIFETCAWLADNLESMYVRGAILTAALKGRMQPKFRACAWDYAVRVLQSGMDAPGYDPTRILKAIDPEAMLVVVSNPALLKPDHPLLSTILSVLNEHGCPPPSNVLRGLLTEATRLAAPRLDSIRKQVVDGLIAWGDGDSLAIVEKILQDWAKSGDEGAISELLTRFRLLGRKTLAESVDEMRNDGKAVDDLPSDMRDVGVIMETLNGLDIWIGFWAWFEYGYGAYRGIKAVQAMKRIGAPRHAEVLAKAHQWFGPDGPPATHEEMATALGQMPDGAYEELERLDQIWNNLPDLSRIVLEWDWNRHVQNDISSA